MGTKLALSARVINSAARESLISMTVSLGFQLVQQTVVIGHQQGMDLVVGFHRELGLGQLHYFIQTVHRREQVHGHRTELRLGVIGLVKHGCWYIGWVSPKN